MTDVLNPNIVVVRTYDPVHHISRLCTSGGGGCRRTTDVKAALDFED